MRIATWNINSLRARMDRVAAFLDRHDVDVLALQEIKAKPAQLDLAVLEEAGYQVAAHGLNQWNGVAIISRVASMTCAQLPDVPPPEDETGVVEARALGAIVGDGLRIWSLYVPNGRELDHPHYPYKLRWLESLRAEGARELEADADSRTVLVGDFNVAPRGRRRVGHGVLRGGEDPCDRARAGGLPRGGRRRLCRCGATRPPGPRGGLHLLGLPEAALPPSGRACASTSCSARRPSRGPCAAPSSIVTSARARAPRITRRSSSTSTSEQEGSAPGPGGRLTGGPDRRNGGAHRTAVPDEPSTSGSGV